MLGCWLAGIVLIVYCCAAEGSNYLSENGLALLFSLAAQLCATRVEGIYDDMALYKEFMDLVPGIRLSCDITTLCIVVVPDVQSSSGGIQRLFRRCACAGVFILCG